MTKVKTLSIKRLRQLRDAWMKEEHDTLENHYPLLLVTSFIEYVNNHRND